ncbi:MAG: nickel pincer cofactor biosynthesis protein LarB [Myxococcota bacterium]
MDKNALHALLQRVSTGETPVGDALERISRLPTEEDLGFAVIDHHRTLRKGFPEVIFGSGKTAAQLLALLEHIQARGQTALATRVDEEKAAWVQARLPEVVYHAIPRALVLAAPTAETSTRPFKGRGPILVVTAGTSDLPVAEEAALTAQLFGQEVLRLQDVGVAGLHRLLARMEVLRKASVVIVVAGMEGALPSVVGGLVDRPVIAVPTSVGYGASFGGLSALLGMLNACASGITVVNIDNGFGAGYAASLMNQD